MKTFTLITAVFACSVTAQAPASSGDAPASAPVPPSCADPSQVNQNLTALLDAADAARYLNNVIPTPWEQCAINITGNTFSGAESLYSTSSPSGTGSQASQSPLDQEFYCGTVSDVFFFLLAPFPSLFLSPRSRSRRTSRCTLPHSECI